MATADELLAGVSIVDKTLVIDNDFRTISIPSSVPNLGVANDNEVLRLDFKMPRYVSDTDLSEFAIRINYINPQRETDIYTIRDEDRDVQEEYITFSWLVGPTATRYKGDTSFIVCAKTLNDDGTIDKEFNTTIASLKVLEGLEVDEAIVTAYTDVIEQWRRELFGIGDTEEASIKAVSAAEQASIKDLSETELASIKTLSETELAAIKDRGVEVLASIPQDYQTAVSMTDNADRTKSDAIVCLARGEVIEVNNSSDDYLRGLRIFGKTTELGDIENPTITINGSSAKTPQHIMLSYTLKAIPVSENGTYVDLNGQEWLADEIDFEHGVCIQRVGFDDPVITPLKAEEIEWFRFAHTNFYETTVSNDAGATMELKYNADTKIWLDNMPKVTDEQAGPLVEAWMAEHFTDGEGVMYGKSAYEIALSRGFVGSEEQWLASLKGRTPVKGVDYYTEEERNEFAADIMAPEFTATPETLDSLIASAPANATIWLSEGTYGRINLHGKNPYSENLTIAGLQRDNVVIAGVSITSGVKSDTIESSGDISNAVLPRGLTVKNATFTDCFSLRNARIDDLTVENCVFNGAANISIAPEYFMDVYGSDKDSAALGHTSDYRYPYAHLKQKNFTIRDCTFNFPDGSKSSLTRSAISVVGIDGATIYHNTINGGSFDGIQVAGQVFLTEPNYNIVSTGKITITRNTINNTKRRGIHVFNVYDGDVIIAENDMTSVNESNEYDEVIIVHDCKDTPFTWKINGTNNIPNRYREESTLEYSWIEVGNGIYFYNTTEVKDPYSNRPKTYIVSSSSKLASVIMSAEPGATIRLTKGDYYLLVLTTPSAIVDSSAFWSEKYRYHYNEASDKKTYSCATTFPENLTIVGDDGVTMNGLCITSGASYDTGPGRQVALLPNGLTIQNIKFTDHVSVRNCEWRNLSIVGCTFAPNASIVFRPNAFGDDHYGSEPGNNISWRVNKYETMLHNVVVKKCKFEGTAAEPARSIAIGLYSVDGAEIIDNEIDDGLTSGITVSTIKADQQELHSCGRFVIADNKIYNITKPGDRYVNGGIAFYHVKNVVGRVRGNTLNNIAPYYAIYGGFCISSEITYADNTRDGKLIASGNGLFINHTNSTAPHEQLTGNPHGTTAMDIGLGNVDNTSDINKPISNKTKTALDLKADKTAMQTALASKVDTVAVYCDSAYRDEASLESWLDNFMYNSMYDNSVKYVITSCYGPNLIGELRKYDNKKASLDFIGIDGKHHSKTKNDGVWNPVVCLLDSHTNSKNNPHGVTASQIGAAPDGYGLGATEGRYAQDCNTAMLNGFYRPGGDNPVNIPKDSTLGYLSYGTLLVETRDGRIMQTARYANYVAKRYKLDYDEPWSEWEYDTPPLFVGYEYRTTERWANKTVWTTLIDCGVIKKDNNTISTNIPCKNVIGTRASVGGHALPHVAITPTTSQSLATYFCTATAMCVDNVLTCFTSVSTSFYDDYSGKRVYIQVWYTKD